MFRLIAVMCESLDKAIAVYGSQQGLATALGVVPQVVNNWRRRGVPAERCPSIEKATAGAVTCEELRPDVDWGYLRATNCPALPEQPREAA